MEQSLPDLKPSAEVQAVVMQLWNVVRETTQAASGAVAERNVIQKKYATLENAFQQEQQKTGKMQHYIEHLEREAKAREEEFTKLQQQYRDGQEISRHREENVQELRRTQLEKEEFIAQLNAQIQEQARIITDRVGEIVAQEDELERLRDELGISHDRAMHVSERLVELEPLYIESQEEKAFLGEEVERLRWQLTAVTEQNTQERTTLDAEYERKLTDAHAENGRLLVVIEDVKRIQGESEQRIRILEEERDAAQKSIQKGQQDAQTWQQIAEEQEQIFSVKEQALREELTRLAGEIEKARQTYDGLQTLHNALTLEKTTQEQASAQALEQLQARLSSEIAQAQTEFHAAQKERAVQHEQELLALRNELDTAQHRASELEAHALELQAHLTQEKDHIQQAETQALERVRSLEEEIVALKNTNEHALIAKSNELLELQTQSAQALEELQARLSSEIAHAQTESHATQEHASGLEQELLALRHELETAQNRASELETHALELQAHLTQEKDHTQQAETQALERVRVLEEEIVALKNTNEHALVAKSNELLELQTQSAQALEELQARLSSEIAHAQTESHAAQERASGLEQELLALRNERDTAQHRASELEAHALELQAHLTQEKDHTQQAETQALERVRALEEEIIALKNTSEHALVARSNELLELQHQLEAEQHRATSALDHVKREAQIRMETELDATRQVMSMKDREIELLRSSVEMLQASSSKAAQYVDEKEIRITELEALMIELGTQRTKLEQELQEQYLKEQDMGSVLHHASISMVEREALAEKVRHMLSRVEAALEEEVR
ncbi:MAG: hypothetical protein EAZ92_05000 [Candidatus Kapaibacterium sp.]|nr:MAG: hypothetical protein EAZ92_05000 [Candidatus Kapabacteria bacterium]